MPAKKGRIPWNKGLTKETDERVRKNAENTSKGKKGHISWRKGLTKEIDERIRKNAENTSKGKKGKLTGKENPNWQPDWNKLGILQKHNRMKKIIPESKKCPICNEEKKLQLTNLDHQYSQNPCDWKWKCQSCHEKWDYKHNNKTRKSIKKMNKKVVVVLSGGMDSTTLLYDVIEQWYEAFAISFYYGQKHKIEIEMAKKTCEKLRIPHKIIDLSALNELAPSALTRDGWDIPEGHYADENMKQTVVPNRNMVLLSLAVAYAIGIGAKKVFYGAHAGDHDIYFDCRPEFVEAMKKAIKLCDWKEITLEAPYLNIDKGDITIKGKELNVDYSLTRTCYTNNELACGKCGSCIERLEAFKKAGIKDPIEYE